MTKDITFWTTIAGAATTAITIIINFITNKTKSKNQKLVELAKIVQKLPNFIQEAESIFGAQTGSAKLAYVLNKVQIECITKKVDYNEEQFKGEIENILCTPEKKETQEWQNAK